MILKGILSSVKISGLLFAFQLLLPLSLPGSKSLSKRLRGEQEEVHLRQPTRDDMRPLEIEGKGVRRMLVNRIVCLGSSSLLGAHSLEDGLSLDYVTVPSGAF